MSEALKTLEQLIREMKRFPRLYELPRFPIPEAEDALANIRADLEQREAVADGWKLAPVEPTEAMLDVACGTGCILSYQEAWRAMMSVVPAPPSTAEAQARALEEMAEEIYQRSLGDDMSESSKDMLCYASGMVRLKAKRTREEG